MTITKKMKNHQRPAETIIQDHLFLSYISFYIYVNIGKLLLKYEHTTTLLHTQYTTRLLKKLALALKKNNLNKY